MSANKYVIHAHVVETMRREAKKLVKLEGIPYHQALDHVARDDALGIRDWHHLIVEAKASATSEQAFKRGLVVGVNPKDTDGYNLNKLTGLLLDDRVVMFLRSEFEDLHPRPWGEDDEYDWEDIEELVYFRHRDVVPNTLEEVLALCSENFFFPPHYVRLRGKEIKLYEEDDDNV